MLKSLETISGVKEKEIVDFINCFNMDNYLDNDISKQRYQGSWTEIFLEDFLATFLCNIDIHSTNWFHITRVNSPDIFYKGLLPLNVIVEDIWNNLYSLSGVSKEEWIKFRNSVEANDPKICLHESNSLRLYKQKVNDIEHVGPYGYLIKDVAFKDTRETLNHDFFESPEIVQDICRCYSAYSYHTPQYVDLESKYIESTKPCIVKFNTLDRNSSNIGIMLLYLHSAVNNYYDNECNKSISNKGVAVQPNNIVYARFVEPL